MGATLCATVTGETAERGDVAVVTDTRAVGGRAKEAETARNPLVERASRKRLMGLEPTTFCWQAVREVPISSVYAGFSSDQMRSDCIRLSWVLVPKRYPRPALCTIRPR
jgi:hypothetical protein